MTHQKMTPEIIKAAILGFEEQKRHIDIKLVELRSLLDGRIAVAVEEVAVAGRKRRKMSAAARKRIAEAQRKRWAAVKTQSGQAPKQTASKRPRLSAAGRAAIIAAAKKRWAAVRAQNRAA